MEPSAANGLYGFLPLCSLVAFGGAPLLWVPVLLCRGALWGAWVAHKAREYLGQGKEGKPIVRSPPTFYPP
eukprot:242280-Amphidinium_carterae.1